MTGAAARVLRYRWVVLGLLAVSSFPRTFDAHQGDWHYFVEASDLVASHAPDGGLHTFAAHSAELHMGPVAVVATWILRIGGGDGFVQAEALMWALGLVSLFLLERAGRAVRGPGRDLSLELTTLLGGALFLKAWMTTAGVMAHLDDVLAMAFTALAAWAAATRRPWAIGLAVGLATLAKPWGVMLMPLCLLGPLRSQIRAAGLAVALTLAGWLPFVLADHATVTPSSYPQPNDPASGLQALGVHADMTPHWVRPSQVGLALALGTIAMLRGRWPAAIAVALATRIAIDPAVYGYYTPTLILGALGWDLLGARRALPIWTAVTYAAVVSAPWVVGDPRALGDLRLVSCAGLVLAALLLPAATRRRGGSLAQLIASSAVSARRGTATSKIAARVSSAPSSPRI